MTEQEMAVALQEAIDRSKSNTHRIDDLEREQRAIHDLATSVAVMAQEQCHMRKDISGLKSSVDTLVAKPGRRWNALVEKVGMTLVAAVVAWLLVQLGIN